MRSLVEIKIMRRLFLFIIIQFLIVFMFVQFIERSEQLDINDTQQIDIIVDDKYIFKALTEHRLVIVADSVNYLFMSRATIDEYSVDELYSSVSNGERLSLVYYESNFLFEKVNIVVDARTETQIYRTFDGYNYSKEGIHIFGCIIFSIIELLFVGGVYIYIWINFNMVKHVFKKQKLRKK